MGKLAVFAGVHKFPARVKCAILPWHAVLAAVEGQRGAGHDRVREHLESTLRAERGSYLCNQTSQSL